MDDAALLSCIGWVAHGFEIVQSVFPNWKFTPADSVAANAMHGALLMGPRHDIGARAAEWLRALQEFEVELYCDGTLVDSGRGTNVLEGPLSVVRYLTGLLARDPDNPPLAAGDRCNRHLDARAVREAGADLDAETQGHRARRHQPSPLLITREPAHRNESVFDGFS
jgi:hypothetical protein